MSSTTEDIQPSANFFCSDLSLHVERRFARKLNHKIAGIMWTPYSKHKYNQAHLDCLKTVAREHNLECHWSGESAESYVDSKGAWKIYVEYTHSDCKEIKYIATPERPRPPIIVQKYRFGSQCDVIGFLPSMNGILRQSVGRWKFAATFVCASVIMVYARTANTVDGCVLSLMWPHGAWCGYCATQRSPTKM